MRSLRSVGLVAALGACAALLAPGRVAAEQMWRVRSREALSLIADRFGVSVDELREWNAIEGDRIFVGQELVIRREGASAPAGGTYTIQGGDTLSGVALRFGVPLEQLRTNNPDIDDDRVREGQEIRIGEARRRVEHTIRAGENATQIAARYGVMLSDLREWNPRTPLDRIRIGRTLVVFTDEPESVSASVGHPAAGRLERAVRLGRHRAYVIRDRDKAWATLETSRWLVEGFDAVLAQHPRSPKVRVHDISNREGGFMSGHRSHQSGRDVDISYYQRFCGDGACPMWRMPPEQLDLERQWTLVEHWLQNDRVEAIFVDYRLQVELYRHARERGATREQLHRWFQYPRGRTHALGVIRHFPQHDDHMHVRFVCPESDPDCR